ncbi:MAG: dTDP-4-dehydrorhamnose reductase [Pseudomonadota bacterium]
MSQAANSPLGILGGGGQLGHALRARATAASVAVTAPSSAEVDVRDRDSVERWLARDRPTRIINAAAFTAVDAAESNRAAAFAVNGVGAGHVAAAAAATGARLVFVSTDYVFADATGDVTENEPTNPTSVYGESKRAGEEATLSRGGAVLRVSWLFGAHGHNFVKTILRRARAGEALRVVDDQRGVPNAATGVAAALLDLSARDDARGIYHYAGTPGVSWHGFAAEILRRAQPLGLVPEDVALSSCSSAELAQPARRPEDVILRGTQLRDALGTPLADWRPELDALLRRIAAEPTLLD